MIAKHKKDKLAKWENIYVLVITVQAEHWSVKSGNRAWNKKLKSFGDSDNIIYHLYYLCVVYQGPFLVLLCLIDGS